MNDLETAGPKVIQADEPALRGGVAPAPHRPAGLSPWATEAFRLATSGVRDDTIHYHMCYCEFGDVMEA